MSEYSEYLQDRHPLSFTYRRRLLYPRYRRWLQGEGLEIGCGLGEFLETCPRFVGVDIDDDLVRLCNEKGLRVQQGSAQRTGHADAAFDAVLLDNVLEHLDAPGPCLDEIRRVLKPGGRALIVVPNALGYERDKTHVQYWDENNLPQFVRERGLTVRWGRHFPLPIKWLGNRVWPYNTYALLLEKPA